MPINYPNTLDDNTTIKSDMVDGDVVDAVYDANANAAIKALEAKVGVNASADVNSLDNRITTVDGRVTTVDGRVTTNLGKPLGLTGATQATRYAGGRASAVPTTGTFAVGDFVVLQTGAIAICTVAGTPGTWVTLSAGSASYGLTVADYIIFKSGANFVARNTATNIDDFTNANAASVVQSAHDALGRAGLIELKRGVAFTATSMVTLSQPGVLVRSSEQSGEDPSTSWTVTSALASDQAAFRVTGTGAGVGGISVDANGNADYGVDMRASGGLFFASNTKAANVANFYLDGPNGAARCMFWAIRSDNPTTQPVRSVTGVTNPSGNTYRFTTSVAHGYLTNQVVALKGFVTTGGRFQVPTTVYSATITATTSTTFDVNFSSAQTFTTSTGTAQRSATNFKLDGADSVAWGLRATGTATAGYALWADTSRIQISSGHITGSEGEAGCVYISGFENRLSDFYLDTGPDGDNGLAHLTIKGSGNQISALVQNAATDVGGATAKNVTATAFVSGTTYRFTSNAHGFAANDGVLLEGFVSSTGFFSGGVTSGSFPIAAVATNTFDIDLGVLTAFTDSVGTATPITVITGTAPVAGNTYRFTTSTTHTFLVGHAVWLQGFASSTGAFLSTTEVNALVTAKTATTFDVDLGSSTTFTDSTGTAKKITKYGLLFQKETATDFVQGNEVHLTFQGKGANLNDGEFYYAVGFLDENALDSSNLHRFAANRIYANAAHTTRFSNLEATWGTITNSDKVFVDAWSYQLDTTTPMVWRTKASGLTAASTASTWTIPHGLAGLPGSVQVTARADPGVQTWYVSSVTATNIVITASGSITNAKWAWKAEM